MKQGWEPLLYATVMYIHRDVIMYCYTSCTNFEGLRLRRYDGIDVLARPRQGQTTGSVVARDVQVVVSRHKLFTWCDRGAVVWGSGCVGCSGVWG